MDVWIPNDFTPLRRKRLSRRTLLKTGGATAVGGAGLALVGCGDDKDEEIEALRAELAEAEAARVEAVLARDGGTGRPPPRPD